MPPAVWLPGSAVTTWNGLVSGSGRLSNRLVLHTKGRDGYLQALGWHPGAQSTLLCLLRPSTPLPVWSSVLSLRRAGPVSLPLAGSCEEGPRGLPCRQCNQQAAACSSVGSLASFLLSQEQRHLSPRVWDAGRSLPLTNWSQSCSRGSPHVSCPPWPRNWLLPGAVGGKDGQKWTLHQERESDLALGILPYRASLLCSA